MNELKAFFLPECTESDNTEHDTNLHDYNYLHDFTSVITEDTISLEEQDILKNSHIRDDITETHSNAPASTQTDHPTDTPNEVILRQSQRNKTTSKRLSM